MASELNIRKFSPYGVSQSIRDHIIWALPLNAVGIVQKDVDDASVRVVRVIDRATGAILSEDVYAIGKFLPPRRRSRTKPKRMLERLVESSVLRHSNIFNSKRSAPPELADRPLQYNADGEKGWWIAIRGRRVFVKAQAGDVEHEVRRQSRETFGVSGQSFGRHKSAGVSTATIMVSAGLASLATIVATAGVVGGLRGTSAGRALTSSIGRFFQKAFRTDSKGMYGGIITHRTDQTAAQAKDILMQNPSWRRGPKKDNDLYDIYEKNTVFGNVIGAVDESKLGTKAQRALRVRRAQKPIKGLTFDVASKKVLESSKHSGAGEYDLFMVATGKTWTVQYRGTILHGVKWDVPIMLRRPPQKTSGNLLDSYVYDLRGGVTLIGQHAKSNPAQSVIFASGNKAFLTKYFNAKDLPKGFTPLTMSKNQLDVYAKVAGAARAKKAAIPTETAIKRSQEMGRNEAVVRAEQIELMQAGKPFNVVQIAGTDKFKLVPVGVPVKKPVVATVTKVKVKKARRTPLRDTGGKFKKKPVALLKGKLLKGKVWEKTSSGLQAAKKYLQKLDNPSGYSIIVINGKYRIKKRSGEEFYTEQRSRGVAKLARYVKKSKSWRGNYPFSKPFGPLKTYLAKLTGKGRPPRKSGVTPAYKPLDWVNQPLKVPAMPKSLADAGIVTWTHGTIKRLNRSKQMRIKFGEPKAYKGAKYGKPGEAQRLVKGWWISGRGGKKYFVKDTWPNTWGKVDLVNPKITHVARPPKGRFGRKTRNPEYLPRQPRSGEEFYTEQRAMKKAISMQDIPMRALLLGSKRGGVIYVSKLMSDVQTIRRSSTKKIIGWLTGLKLADLMFDVGLKRNVPELKRFITATARKIPNHLTAFKKFGDVAVARAAFSELAAKKGYGRGELSSIYAPTSQYPARMFMQAWRAIARLGVV